MFSFKGEDFDFENALGRRQAYDSYRVDQGRKWLMVIALWSLTCCIAVMAGGFVMMFGKHIVFLVFHGETDPKTSESLSVILDWTMKIVIGWLAKSFFEKRVF